MRTPPSAPRPGGFDVEQAAPVDIDPLVYAAFLEYDRDHSGAISREEAAKMIKALALPVSDNYVQRTWDAYDTDGSGVLDLQEFAVMMKEGIFRNALHLVKTPGHSTAPVAPTRTGSTRPPATPLQVVGNPLAQQPPAVAPRPSGGVTTLRVSAPSLTTLADARDVNARLRTEIKAELKAEMRAEVRAELKNVRAELKNELRSEMEVEMDSTPPQPNSMLAMQNGYTANRQPSTAGHVSSSGCLQKLGLGQPNDRPPLCHACVNVGVGCCCCCICTPPLAHFLARPYDVMTPSFLGLCVYYCVFYASTYLILSDDPAKCIGPTDYDDETGAPEYPLACTILSALQFPMLLYTLFVVLWSEKQYPSGKPPPCSKKMPSKSGAVDLERGNPMAT